MTASEIKQLTGYHAVDNWVVSNMNIGIGAGSTVEWVVRRIGERLRANELRGVRFVVAAYQTALLAQDLGIALCTLDDPAINGRLDIAIDGADEVDPQGRLIKGGGGALFPEKIIAYSARQMVVVVDESKMVNHLGDTVPLPIEVAPQALSSVRRRVGRLCKSAGLRMALRKMGPVITDSGNMILDLQFDPHIEDPTTLETKLNEIPGVIENGLFTAITTRVLIGRSSGVVERLGG